MVTYNNILNKHEYIY